MFDHSSSLHLTVYPSNDLNFIIITIINTTEPRALCTSIIQMPQTVGEPHSAMSSSTSNQPDPPNLTLTTIEPSHDTAYWSWEKQKTRIWNLLYHEKVPQKELPKRMKVQFGFSAP